MGFYNRSGKEIQPQDISEQFGYTFNPMGRGDSRFIGPNGEQVSDQAIWKMGIDQNLIIPGPGSEADARAMGYTGGNIEQEAARSFGEREMEGMPGYDSQIDPATGLLRSPYQMTDPDSILGEYRDIVEQYGLPGLEKAMGGADELAGIARDTGFSPYATAQMEQQRLEEAGQRDTLQDRIAGARATGLSGLASSGGYDSGARERMIRGTGVSGLFAGQNIARGGAESRAGIGASDAAYKQNLLSSLPGMYSGLATTGTSMWNPYLQQATTEQGYGQETKQFNIDKALAERSGARGFELDKFKLQKQLQSSARQSYAESPSPYSFQQDLYT